MAALETGSQEPCADLSGLFLRRRQKLIGNQRADDPYSSRGSLLEETVQVQIHVVHCLTGSQILQAVRRGLRNQAKVKTIKSESAGITRQGQAKSRGSEDRNRVKMSMT
ncbi:hypothetical protein CRENBAI_012655 [Crenichthys baileyi]|uniref:Uncharacterized protein n=1 Tax=Crenichthys baileyi TaxID=28760 RepID=A0AAV9SBP5_9TELE